MAKKILPGIERRNNKKSYKNFNLALFVPVGNMKQINDLEAFDKKFETTFSNMKIGRVYLEDFRGLETCDKEQILKVKKYFESKGIETCGGMTTCGNDSEYGFSSLCYSDEEVVEKLREAVALNAELFDEFLMDDFYFYNCRCEKCVKMKGNRTWQQFRLERKRWVTEDVIMKTAHEVNPDVNVILKFPQWFEDFNHCGYDLDIDTSLMDSIYTGTESRNPTYSQQHLPRYLSYMTMRYYGSNKPGKNLGGWFDPFELTYNLTNYLSQAYLTLFAKAPEMTLFALGSLMDDPQFRIFPYAMGEMLNEVDGYLGKLGNPVGVAAYHPSGGRGENNIHSYLGQCGIPMEPLLDYPEDEQLIFLAESATKDETIIEKMQKGLMEGKDFVVTSGFVKAVGEAFEEFGYVSYTDKKARVQSYCTSENHGVNVSRKFDSADRIIIPQIDYSINDVWEIAGAYGHDNNFPIVLSWSYGKGTVSVITIPDDLGDIYSYPKEVLYSIRSLFTKKLGLTMEGPAGIELFLFDNNTLILRSDLPYEEKCALRFEDGETIRIGDGIIRGGKSAPIEDKPGRNCQVIDLINESYTGTMDNKEMDDKMVRQGDQSSDMKDGVLALTLASCVNRVFKLQK